ncbi:hypothetical protein [Mucilaginibacter sp.]|uniref:hypothetical protein n=1 Tax=Mucilaginibacter sp. TaxID=1882438 RepID=UPI002619AA48|nr:hypothetical protein [Mucilaginibacter sp.]MDB4921841.1 hypothetical protein [Mucilaginibacter sp.]
MKKLRPVPLFTIEGTSFLVDIEKQVLRQTNDHANEISFINDMQDHGAFYRLLYDPDELRAAKDLFDQNRVKVIDVPQMTDLDREGMAARYGLPPELVMGKSDFELIVDQEALDLRLKGALPRIDIAGEGFIIDLRLQELRHAKNFHPVISLKSFGLSGDGSKYEAFYHPLLKQVVKIDPKLTEFPGSVVRIQIPNGTGLDPVAAARQYGMEERELLRRYPIQKELKAAVIPLSETHIPALIRRNREQLRREHQEIVRQMKPKNRPRF